MGQIRNGNESLNDINKKLNEYNIEDPSNFLVLRDDILDAEDNESKDSEDKLSIDEDMKDLDTMKSDLLNISSPQMPTVPNNSFVTESNGLDLRQSQGLYSALESLASSKNKKGLNSLSTQQQK